MFRLIGFAVVVFVLVVGFRPIKSLFEGTRTPSEALEQVRLSVGQTITPNVDGSAQQTRRAADLSNGTDATEPESAGSSPSDDTEAMARRLLQKANSQDTN
ncbi:hypothetical protein P3T40_002985 [Paraburkholderia sp. EB58]|jgi:hypothetical protein|uniref:hypothetical protein n=1 Tax=Paraburkholderia sp. EB58 TaxID=3035125 RepID=UPI003D22A3A9